MCSQLSHLRYRRSPCGSADRNLLPCRASWRGQVAPRAGARIETAPEQRSEGHPDRRSPCGSADRNFGCADGDAGDGGGRSPCGSADRNRAPAHKPGAAPGSLPVRERGSKLRALLRIRKQEVAPRAGARIETGHAAGWSTPPAGRSPCGSADRNMALARRVDPDGGRSPCGSADRNLTTTPAARSASRRSPCGSADRNWQKMAMALKGTPSLPVRERGSKRRWTIRVWPRQEVAPRAGATVRQSGG